MRNPTRLNVRSAVLGLTLGLPGAYAATEAPALISSVFKPGTPIRSEEVNVNFAALAQGWRG